VPPVSEKIKITFVIHESLRKELREKMIKENYGLRGKSKWVSEAIQLLLSMKNYPELVNLSNDLKKFEKTETIVIEPSLRIELDKAIVEIRKTFPTLEGVQSRIVRTAIMQRVLRNAS
jgi:hypothetical protein